MSKKIIVGVVVVIIIGGIWIVTNKHEKDGAMMKDEDSMMEQKDGAMMEDKDMMKDESSMMKGDEAMMQKDDTMMEGGDMMMKAGMYEMYTPEKIAMASNDHDVVLFFKADWCPTCRAVDANIKANLNNIPSDLSILEINYDNSTALKQKYGVTMQHTFVQVDAQGNLIKKWTGSPTLAMLVTEVI